ncbi:class I adenylate-forming enzyme family protein [Thermogemmatispora sp.]|uniref:class I adenylate-forming enzyme family protein n=1 Tax=Thermogemmatispora sp. TaxID=1968838 RepID=UPI001E13B80D|nr:AMP-binding protein [Thermogemmatispora sp.]MBX5450249.1 AMP-binding protein [Thermogemmatispora sp.]
MVDKQTAPELFRPPLGYPEVPYDALVRAVAERQPERPAIIYHNLSLTYCEVTAMANSLANGLRALGLGKGDIICLFTFNRPEYTISFLAASSIGAVISPMNPSYKEREITYQLENSEACAILVQRELVATLKSALNGHSFPALRHIIVTGAQVPEGLPQAIPFARLLREASPRPPEPVPIAPDDLLALPYSSGTTGLPRGVMLSHRNLVCNHLQVVTAANLSPADATLIFLPLYHIYGVLLTGTFLIAGGRQILMERFDLDAALTLCEQQAVTWFFAVPPIVQALLNASDEQLAKLRTVKYLMSAAAPLAPELAIKLRERTGINVIQAYGLTEASPDTHFSPLDPAHIRPASGGLPVYDTEQKIVDLETGERELPAGEDGEIIVRGPQVMLGYWKDPAETARVLRNGWLYTGDIGHIDAEGYLYIVDRKKEMIKYKAFSIAPAEIEAVLLEHPAVLDAAVIGVDDPEAGEIPKAFVVLRSGQTASAEELMAFVNSKLAGYKKLHLVEFIEAIPRVPSGKILRRQLKERERARRLANTEGPLV